MGVYEIISLVLNALIVLTGFSAVGLYLWQQHTNRRTAATLVITQVDRIETTIKSILSIEELTEKDVYQFKQILSQNYWDQHRYLLSKYLGECNVRLVEDFYSNVEEIEKAREAIVVEITTTWSNKDFIYQEQLLKEIYENKSFDVKQSGLDDFGKYGQGFSAALPMNMLKRSIGSYKPLSGTMAYEKLWKLSYHS